MARYLDIAMELGDRAGEGKQIVTVALYVTHLDKTKRLSSSASALTLLMDEGVVFAMELDGLFKLTK
jgi:hypothetical protein